MSDTEQKQSLKLNDISTSFLKVGKTVYAIREIQSDGLDLEREIKEFYAKQYDKEVASVRNAVVAEIAEEHDKQLMHIQSFRGRSQVAIPQDMFDKPLCYWRGMMLELRCIIYSPCAAHTSISYLTSNDIRLPESMFPRKSGRVIGSTKQLYVQFNPTFAMPLHVGYDKRTGNIYTPFFRTYHTMGGYNVCTGNHSGKDFWTLSDENLEANFNRINMFSPAHGAVHVAGHSYRFKDLINEDTVTQITERGESEQWRI